MSISITEDGILATIKSLINYHGGEQERKGKDLVGSPEGIPIFQCIVAKAFKSRDFFFCLDYFLQIHLSWTLPHVGRHFNKWMNLWKNSQFRLGISFASTYMQLDWNAQEGLSPHSNPG